MDFPSILFFVPFRKRLSFEVPISRAKRPHPPPPMIVDSKQFLKIVAWVNTSLHCTCCLVFVHQEISSVNQTSFFIVFLSYTGYYVWCSIYTVKSKKLHPPLQLRL